MTKMAHVPVSKISGKALAWAVAAVRGRALRDPIPASYEAVKGLEVPFELFDVDIRSRGEEIIDAKVFPVTVERCGINVKVGASAPSIDVRYHCGERASASIDMFYLTKEEAEIDAQRCLHGSVRDYDPVNDWAECGKLIDEFGILFQAGGHGELIAYLRADGLDGPSGRARDHRTAALRCVLAARVGNVVVVPAELVD